MAHRDRHSVSLKVMRLRRPNLVPQASTIILNSPFTTPPIAQIQKSTIIDPIIEGTGLTGLAALPNGFGSMFVGTDFLAYVCLNNESEEEVDQVQVTAELRAPPNKYPLKPKVIRIGAAKDYTMEEKHKLIPGEALHVILDHRVRQAGEHTLEVGVTYLPPGAEHTRTFRKMYNFTTFETLSLRSNSLPYQTRSVLSQIQIQNSGDSPLVLSRITFLPENVWDVKSCNEFEEGESVWAERELLPREVVQVSFLLVPRFKGEGEMPFALGRVEVEWVGGMGERGSLVSQVFNRRPI